MNMRTFAIVVIAISVIILGFQFDSCTLAKGQTLQPTTSHFTSSNFLTYTNGDYNFSIAYPPDFKVREVDLRPRQVVSFDIPDEYQPNRIEIEYYQLWPYNVSQFKDEVNEVLNTSQDMKVINYNIDNAMIGNYTEIFPCCFLQSN
jgi:hypothetical protein